MVITQITNEVEYNTAMERLEIIFDAEFGTTEGDELDTLGTLIDEYEMKHFPME